jgi:hypothetical protein
LPKNKLTHKNNLKKTKNKEDFMRTQKIIMAAVVFSCFAGILGEREGIYAGNNDYYNQEEVRKKIKKWFEHVEGEEYNPSQLSEEEGNKHYNSCNEDEKKRL